MRMRRWASQGSVFEIDLGASLTLRPNALTAIAAFPRLSHLTCHVQGSLPASVTGLARLEGLHIIWESNMDDGAPA